MFLQHYFNKENGPFRSISDLSEKEAKDIWYNMASYLVRKNGGVYNSSDFDEMIIGRYEKHRHFEHMIRNIFIEKGGKAPRNYPYYLILSVDNLPDKALLEC